MKANEKERLGLAFFILKEFSYGVDNLELLLGRGAKQGSSAVRFHMNSLYHYIASWFLLDGGGYLEVGLKGLGFENRLQLIAKRLSRRIGNATLGDLIRIHRNKFLVHNDRFGTDVWNKKIEADAGIPDAISHEDIAKRFPEDFQELCDEIQGLFFDVADRLKDDPDFSESVQKLRSKDQ